MKKRILLLMTMTVLAVGMMACGKDDSTQNKGDNNAVSTEKDDKKSPEVNMDELTTVGVLENVWAVYGEEDKPMVFGGDTENPVDGAPGVYNIADVEGINSMFHINADAVAMADEAASAVHAMNANNFTCSVFRMTDAANVEAFATSVKESVLSTRWMCGFPEKLVILSVDDKYVISAFGNGDMIDLFQENVTTVYGEYAAVVAEEIIE